MRVASSVRVPGPSFDHTPPVPWDTSKTCDSLNQRVKLSFIHRWISTTQRSKCNVAAGFIIV